MGLLPELIAPPSNTDAYVCILPAACGDGCGGGGGCCDGSSYASSIPTHRRVNVMFLFGDARPSIAVAVKVAPRFSFPWCA